jgi:hypothetical protein
MSSVDTLAKRVREKNGNLEIKYIDKNWIINMSFMRPLQNGLHEEIVMGGQDMPLSKVANMANGVLK